MAISIPDCEIWFVTGSQHLYGEETLRQVEKNSKVIVAALNDSARIPSKVVFKPVMTDPAAVRRLCLEANSAPECAGLVLWMHTFSPAKMWIGGLTMIRKPVAHLHTQFNKELPWKTIDMDYMNLNQSAHGDREAGHLHTRLKLARKVIVGHWSDESVQDRLAAWMRVAQAWADLQGGKIARFGDNMREVSVTEGDKVSAEATFGFSVNGFGLKEIGNRVDAVSGSELQLLLEEYADSYDLSPALQVEGANRFSLEDAARLEIAIKTFLESGGFKGFTTTFENLNGLKQLPGLACQRLMNEGYGFGAEGDWKTAALLRFMKIASAGLPGGTSFMEDYTYDLTPGNELVLGAHMLEICPSLATTRPKLEVHPLGIGGKEDPPRLVFDAPAGPALNASLVDIGPRFRLIVNEVDAIPSPPLPKLPVARAVWKCRPDFKTSATCWIYAGGAHHTGYSYSVTTEQLRDFAEISGIEIVVIDGDTKVESFRNELRWNDLAYRS